MDDSVSERTNDSESDFAHLRPNNVGLKYFPPPADLADYFGAIYHFTVDRPQVSDQTRADFAQIRLMLKGAGHYHFSDSTTAPTPESCMLGPTLGATRFVLTGPVDVLGISVLPLGWAALHFGEAADIADSVMDLSIDPGGDWGALCALCRTKDSIDAAADYLWSFLREKIQPVSDSDRDFIATVEAWLMGEDWPRVSTLIEMTQLSDRQLARLSNRLYGAPPRFLARKYRALRSAQRIARHGSDWTDFVDDAFYDQSHFIRELKHFVGLTPVQLRDRASMLMQLTLRRREIEGLASPLLRES